MKKIFNIFILIFSVLIISSCGVKEKSKLTSADFKKEMEKREFSVIEGNTLTDNKDLKLLYVASEKSNHYSIEFYEFKDAESAGTFYNTNTDNLRKYEDKARDYNKEEKSNFSRYEISLKDKYKVISRIDNTVLLVNVDSDYDDEASDLVKELGY
jgi:hypothetical protein